MKHNGGIRMIVLVVITALCITGILVAAFLFNSGRGSGTIDSSAGKAGGAANRRGAAVPVFGIDG